MSDYIKHKEYKLPNGGTVTAYFNELGLATITIQAMDALFDILNSPDAVEVVMCKDCKHWKNDHLCQAWSRYGTIETKADQYCSYGERKEE